jgi:hypothetical protein
MKKLLLYPLRLLDGLVDRLLAVAGALALVQFPQFYAQYLQRLGGHLDEARRTVEQYVKAASSYNLTLKEYINIYLTSNNKIFVSSGKIINDLVERWEHLQASFRALKAATPLNRWLVFLREMDPEISRQTWFNFTPGIPTTTEALVYALIGLLAAWGIYQGVKSLFRLIFRLIFRRKPTSPGQFPGKPGIPA